MWRLRGMSDDMDGKIRDGTWEALAGPTQAQYATWEGVGGDPSYKETKEREAGRVADEAVVPVKLWKHNRGKGLC